MPNHIDLAQVKAMKVVNYATLRETLKSGDLFFASGDYLVSKAIEKMTDSPWSHVGIVFVLPQIDRVLLLESVEDMGVRLAPLSKYLSDYDDIGKPYKGRVVLARYDVLSKSAVEQVAAFGLNELTRPYDKEEIARILARIALGKGKSKKDREYICSELVYACFNNAGISIAYNPKGFISPEDVWQDSHISLINRIL
ncbi:YiiX/YebB-like N1pC/P60 family cysteine hydrolase [Citrobacter europaeus]|uniref:YiiX/YebB-like N1pC/P60 family cysteine hydrolase n=1 Tax=Citrobacter europaeus TaxID=1914243 RepID=UPI00397DCD7E